MFQKAIVRSTYSYVKLMETLTDKSAERIEILFIGYSYQLTATFVRGAVILCIS